jgi:carboxymethylenebutenolidase
MEVSMTTDNSAPDQLSYLAEPQAGGGPGVLVVHDWYGLLPSVQERCDALAAAGFVALAPDLYQGRTAANEAEAERLMGELDAATARKRLDEAVGWLAGAASGVGDGAPGGGTGGARSGRAGGGSGATPSRRANDGGRIGAVGFSMGGSLVLQEATAGTLDAAVAYYATLGPAAAASVACPVLLQFAEVDEWDPDETPQRFLETLREHGEAPEVFTYPGTVHSFANADIAALFAPDASAAAWTRTVGFLERHLR